ncbi:MAG: DegT/DnrJ/EryC1/StrS family aminotransferase [Pseudomonadota bacterium]
MAEFAKIQPSGPVWVPEALEEPVFVTRPRMPEKAAYKQAIDRLWDNKWLTNNGEFHRALETRLQNLVGEGEVALTANGTLSLLLALKIAGVEPGKKIITTPFTFAATTHAIDWVGCEPVFADIDPVTGNIDPAIVANLVDEDVAAVLPVHVFGTPCDHGALQAICDDAGMPLVYDAAHSFATKLDGRSVFALGTASATSFHATKLFSTAEGGAVFVRSREEKQLCDRFKNFGIASQDKIERSGLNMKMSEFHAAFGLLGLDGVQHEIEQRQAIATTYMARLAGIDGIRAVTTGIGFEPNWSYFAICVDEKRAGISRDDLFDALAALTIHCRKYFYPLTSHTPAYAVLETAGEGNLPVAHRFEREVMCLPIFGDLPLSSAGYIADAIRALVGYPPISNRGTL